MGKQLLYCWKTGKLMGLVLLVLLLRSANPALAQREASLLFIENVGQFPGDDQTRFLVQMGDTTLHLADEALWLTLRDHPTLDPTRADVAAAGSPAVPLPSDDESGRGVHLKLSFAGANPQPRLEPFEPLEPRVSFFIGNDPAHWRANVPVWGGVRYVDLYPGIDWEVTGENGQLVQRLVVKDQATVAAAGAETSAADPLEQVSLQIEGADSVTLDGDDHLHLTTPIAEITLPLLQAISTGGTPLDSPVQATTIDGDNITAPFTTSPDIGISAQATGAHLSANAEVPELIYGSFLGSSAGDNGKAIAVDDEGNTYILGSVGATDFPTTPGAFSTSNREIFIAKLNANGDDLIYVAFLGGSGPFDTTSALALDGANNAYIAGTTNSADFPATPGAFDTSLDGLYNAFVVKLNAAGNDLVYATFLGGSNLESGDGIAVDATGAAYVTGATYSDDFPTTPMAYDSNLGGGSDAFVAKLNAAGSDLVYATLLGGDYFDYGIGVAVDGAGYAYLSGNTWSADFPATAGAFDKELSGRSDTFVAKLNLDGSALDYATFLGGNDHDPNTGIAVDAAGQAYVIGDAWSDDFPTTPNAYATILAGNNDIYVTKLNGDGSGLVYSTLIGGAQVENSYDLALDEAGSVYLTGYTVSGDFPVTNGTQYSPTCSDCVPFPINTEAFATKLTPNGTAVAYGTFLGGGLHDYGNGITVDKSGHIYVTGYTGSVDFPVTASAFDTTLSDNDAFITKLAAGDTMEPPSPVPAHTCAPTPLGEIIVGHTPRGLVVDPARQRLYVANFGSNSVSVIDTGTNTIQQTMTGLTTANGLAYDSTHNLIWVTNYDLDQLTPIQANDQATGFTVLSPITVGEGPWGVTFDPIHNLIYVANSLDNTVSVIDAESRTLVATLTGSFDQPFHLATHSLNGKVYVANAGNNTVTVLQDASIIKTVPLWDSGAPYGIAVDETRDLIYVATVQTNRIVALGPLNGQPDQFLGWAAFQRGYNRHRPVPLRAIAVNPEIGPAFDGGHVWATTATGDGSEADQALFIPKGWSSYFHVPFPQDVGTDPTEGISIDRLTQRVYVSSGTTPGVITVIGDHETVCSGIAPAAVAEDNDQINLDIFSLANATRSDINADGQVNISDLAYVAGRFGSDDPKADINGDGSVDIADLAIVANHFGQHLPEFD